MSHSLTLDPDPHSKRDRELPQILQTRGRYDEDHGMKYRNATARTIDRQARSMVVPGCKSGTAETRYIPAAASKVGECR